MKITTHPHTNSLKFVFRLTLAASLLALTACGGGGKTSHNTTPISKKIQLINDTSQVINFTKPTSNGCFTSVPLAAEMKDGTATATFTNQCSENIKGATDPVTITNDGITTAPTTLTIGSTIITVTKTRNTLTFSTGQGPVPTTKKIQLINDTSQVINFTKPTSNGCFSSVHLAAENKDGTATATFTNQCSENIKGATDPVTITNDGITTAPTTLTIGSTIITVTKSADTLTFSIGTPHPPKPTQISIINKSSQNITLQPTTLREDSTENLCFTAPIESPKLTPISYSVLQDCSSPVNVGSKHINNITLVKGVITSPTPADITTENNAGVEEKVISSNGVATITFINYTASQPAKYTVINKSSATIQLTKPTSNSSFKLSNSVPKADCFNLHGPIKSQDTEELVFATGMDKTTCSSNLSINSGKPLLLTFKNGQLVSPTTIQPLIQKAAPPTVHVNATQFSLAFNTTLPQVAPPLALKDFASKYDQWYRDNNTKGVIHDTINKINVYTTQSIGMGMLTAAMINEVYLEYGTKDVTSSIDVEAQKSYKASAAFLLAHSPSIVTKSSATGMYTDGDYYIAEAEYLNSLSTGLSSDKLRAITKIEKLLSAKVPTHLEPSNQVLAAMYFFSNIDSTHSNEWLDKIDKTISEISDIELFTSQNRPVGTPENFKPLMVGGGDNGWLKNSSAPTNAISFEDNTRKNPAFSDQSGRVPMMLGGLLVAAYADNSVAASANKSYNAAIDDLNNIVNGYYYYYSAPGIPTSQGVYIHLQASNNDYPDDAARQTTFNAYRGNNFYQSSELLGLYGLQQTGQNLATTIDGTNTQYQEDAWKAYLAKLGATATSSQGAHYAFYDIGTRLISEAMMYNLLNPPVDVAHAHDDVKFIPLTVTGFSGSVTITAASAQPTKKTPLTNPLTHTTSFSNGTYMIRAKDIPTNSTLVLTPNSPSDKGRLNSSKLSFSPVNHSKYSLAKPLTATGSNHYMIDLTVQGFPPAGTAVDIGTTHLIKSNGDTTFHNETSAIGEKSAVEGVIKVPKTGGTGGTVTTKVNGNGSTNLTSTDYKTSGAIPTVDIKIEYIPTSTVTACTINREKEDSPTYYTKYTIHSISPSQLKAGSYTMLINEPMDIKSFQYLHPQHSKDTNVTATSTTSQSTVTFNNDTPKSNDLFEFGNLPAHKLSPSATITIDGTTCTINQP